jgi:hypothetical protein
LVFLILGGVIGSLQMTGAQTWLDHLPATTPLRPLILGMTGYIAPFLTIWTIVPVWCTTTTILYFESRRIYGVRTSIVALSFSLFLTCAAISAATDYVGLSAKLADGRNVVSIAKEIASDHSVDAPVADAARQVLRSFGATRKAAVADLIRAVQMRANAATATQLGDADYTRRMAVQAKSSPFYSDPGEKQSSNWIGKGFEKLSHLNIRTPDRGPDIRIPTGGFYFLIYVVWGLLGAALLTLAYLAFRHFSWRRNLHRKAKAMLEHDEPERTLDEWLELADRLTAEGKFREAVRCLYLACLLRFDEHLVARFDRGQTNWEHLSRIRASAKLPLGLDFEPPTKRFDTIWYGQRTRGQADVDQFRDWYQRISNTLKEGAS